MRPLGSNPTGEEQGEATTVGQPMDRRAFLRDAGKALGLGAAMLAVPGLARAQDAAEAEPQSAAQRVELMKASAFNAWAYSDKPQVPPHITNPELLSPEFLETHNIQALGEPIGPFVRTSAMDGNNPTDEISMDTPLGVEQEMTFMFAVFVPKGQSGTVRVRWECDGEVYKNLEGSTPRHVAPHNIEDVTTSNGFRLHDTARFPKAGTWKATVTMTVKTDGQEDEEVIKLGSFEVPVQ